MTLERANRTVASVQAVRDRSLVEAYEPHDFAQELLEDRLERHGFTVEQHGDDARHADEILYGDGPDLAVYRLAPNVKPNECGLGSTFINTNTGRFVSSDNAYELVAYIEVKSKEHEKWYGRCNRRHFNEYVNFAAEVDVPVFIWFALVDADDGVCLRDDFLQVEDTDQIDGEVIDTDTEIVFEHDDIEHVTTTDEGREMYAVNKKDIINVSRGDQITAMIPSVHGNDVVCLNEDELRSTPYILNQLIQ